MSKLINAKKLDEFRNKNKAKLEGLIESNSSPLEAVESAARELPMLKPYTTGDPVRDIVGINHQLNSLPGHFEGCNEKQLREAWEGAEKMGRATAWVKGHIILTISRKYKEAAVKKFAEEQGLTFKTLYNYLKLAELFPKVDPILEPTFHFKAIALAHGDKDKAVKLIEKAKEKRRSNPRYSVRDFMGENEPHGKSKSAPKAASADVLAVRIIKGLRELAGHAELAKIKSEIADINRIVERINLSLKKSQTA